MKPLFISDAEFFSRHHPGSAHPESPDRVWRIQKVFTDEGIGACLPWVTDDKDFESAVALAHSDLLRSNLEQADRAAHETGGYSIDADTFLSAETLQVSRRACQSVLEAARAIMDGAFKQAFCALRPPGHHAESNRAMGIDLILKS